MKREGTFIIRHRMTSDTIIPVLKVNLVYNDLCPKFTYNAVFQFFK